jgi:hypothetical protein
LHSWSKSTTDRSSAANPPLAVNVWRSVMLVPPMRSTPVSTWTGSQKSTGKWKSIVSWVSTIEPRLRWITRGTHGVCRRRSIIVKDYIRP